MANPIAHVAWLLTLCVPLCAQRELTTLRGTVFDPHGRRAPGVQITAAHLKSGSKRKAISSNEGTYVMPGLAAGAYTVSFMKDGFRVVELHADQSLGETTTLDANLPLAPASDEATVADVVANLIETSGKLSGRVETKQLLSLPMNGRNWSTSTALGPGALDSGTGNQRSIRFAGRGVNDNNVTLDGVDATGIMSQNQQAYVRLAIPIGAISELRVDSMLYGADLGGAAGGQISVASAAGSQQFHGSVFEFIRNDVLDARSALPPADGPAPFRLNDFGATLGGPIWSHRTFFYANYEGFRQRLGVDQFGFVPSDRLIQRSSASADAVLAAYPAGVFSTKDPNIDIYSSTLRQMDDENSSMIRIDHRFTDRFTGFMRFNTDEAVSTSPAGQLAVLSETRTNPRNGMIQLLQVLSPTLVNESKFGLNQVIFHTANFSAVPYSVSVPGFSTVQGGKTTDQAGTSFSWIDAATWVRGRHILKAGVELRAIRMNQGNSADGTLTYQGPNALAANHLQEARITGLLPLKRLRKIEYFGFLQDEWKVKSNLALHIGLRYEFYNVFHEVDGRAIPFDFESCGGYCKPGSDFSFPNTHDLDPRVSLGWSPTWSHGRTVFRSGFGIFHGDGQLGDSNLPIFNDVQAYRLTNQVPGLSYPVDPFLLTATGIVTPKSLYRRRKDMYVTQWGASVQQKFPHQVVGTVSYVGSKGTDLLTRTFTNVLDPVTHLQPFPSFGRIDLTGNGSNSSFQALQFSARRYFRTDWLLSANYMWSHSIDDGSVGGGEADTPQNVGCRSCDRASSDHDIRHAFNMSYVYAIPYRPANGLLRSLFGRWEVSGVALGRTGRPINVTVSRSASDVPDGNTAAQRPGIVPGLPLTPVVQSPDQWLNPSAFTKPPLGSWGNAGRNLVRGPALWQIDSSLSKHVRITESSELEFRAEVFNVLNRAQYGNPLSNISASGQFGQIVSSANTGSTGNGTPRQLQFMLRYSF